MRVNKSKSVLLGLIGVLAASALSGCGDQEAGAPGILIQSNPLAGPNQASYPRSPSILYTAGDLAQAVLGIQLAHAAVTPYNALKVCVSEVVWELYSGSTGTSSAPLRPGLMDFSPVAVDAMAIGYLDIAPGSVLKNIKFTIANRPELCGVSYSVLFNSGSSGDIQVTQDMSFRFDFDSAGYTVQDGTAITVFLGDIVNGMAALGTGLNNSTIQGVNVGQAQ